MFTSGQRSWREDRLENRRGIDDLEEHACRIGVLKMDVRCETAKLGGRGKIFGRHFELAARDRSGKRNMSDLPIVRVLKLARLEC